MPSHMSNSDRIAHAAAEAQASEREKTAVRADKATKAAATAAKARVRKPRAPKAPPRMKIVWGVGPHGGAVAATYPYTARAEADAEVAKKGKGWVVTAQRVLMVDEPVAK